MSYAKAQRARKVGIFEHRQPDYGNREPAKMAVASPSKWAKPGSAHLSAMVTTHSSTRSVGIPLPDCAMQLLSASRSLRPRWAQPQPPRLARHRRSQDPAKCKNTDFASPLRLYVRIKLLNICVLVRSCSIFEVVGLWSLRPQEATLALR